MKENRLTVDEWVAMFQAIGLTEEDMHKWHAEFERSHALAHQGFLEWLGLPADRIAKIRATSAAG